MSLTGQLIDQLRRDEGWKHRAYQDSRGVWTIGCGHNLESTPITDEAIERILMDDLEDVLLRCRRFPWWVSLSEARQGVVVNMAFNLGLGGFSGFRRMIDALVEGDWNRAADEMLDSEWSEQVGARAQRLAIQMRSDEWQ
mgnify:CR=1 FL=1